MSGVTEARSMFTQIISILAFLAGCWLAIKGVADIWKISDDIKRGQATVFAYSQPIVMSVVAGGIIYLSNEKRSFDKREVIASKHGLGDFITYRLTP
ncbi:CagC family type IV secretion system protein [Helicobacter pylori]|uniref:CagC family type IV secretion system protein n=1 Tax=Helicobacter pylori TaxID=210 RepID=UPI0009B0FF54